MNNKVIIAASIAAAGIATYLFTKKNKIQGNNREFVGTRSHHLTNAFTRAKTLATRTME
jgi:hypothetical protein